MRILHVIDKLSMDGVNPSSCTVLFGGWAHCLRQRNCEIEVLSLSNDNAIVGYLTSRDIPTSFVNRPKHSIQNIQAIAAHAANRSVDLIHLHGYGAAHFGRIAARRARIPNIVHEHAVLDFKPHHFALDWLLRNKTDVAIAVSDYVKKFMIKVRSIPESRIHIIGNGIDLTRFRRPSADEIDAARAELGIQGGTKVVGTVTRFRVEKGNEYLIRAFRKIHAQHKNVRLVLIGDGPDKGTLRDLAKQLGLGDAIDWLGFRGDVEKLMPIFDVHVIPSLTEGFPLALAEGMAAGNAMVVTEVGGMREIGVDGTNVVFVPPEDPDRIAVACLELLSNPEVANEIARNGMRTSEKMSIEKSSSELHDLYAKLVANRGVSQ